MLKNQFVIGKRVWAIPSHHKGVTEISKCESKDEYQKVTLIPSLPKLTLFVIFGVLERNIPVKQTGEVQQLCVQSCVRVLKNTKDMEINITIALTPRMSLTKGIQNQFFPESPEEWLFLAYLPVIFFTYKYYCKINRPPCRKTDKIP